MDWFNYYGLIFVAIILIPNIVFAVKHKNDLVNLYNNKPAIFLEQLSRYACMAFMVINVPYTYTNFYFSYAEAIYIAVNAFLVLSYCLIWIILWKKSGIVKAILLSAIPAFVFLFSAIIIGSIPLFVFASIFAATHILISIKNARLSSPEEKPIKKVCITVTAIILTLVMVSVCCLGGIAAYGQNRLSKLDKMTAEEMLNYDAQEKDAKISVAFIDNGVITYSYYGFDGKEKYDYEIGSISKTFVGLLYSKAIAEGKVSLDDSIAVYLGFDQDRYYPTLRRLLTHTSGYDGYYFDGQMIANRLSPNGNDYRNIGKEKILAKVKSVRLEDKDYPYVYSNFGIAVAGLVLEKVYDKDFTALMNEYIFSELLLSDTKVAKESADLSSAWIWEKADGYIPAGAIISNIEDMADYLKIYTSDRFGYSPYTYCKQKSASLNNPTYEKMNIHADAIGLTWMIDETNGIIWHNGGTSDYNSYIGFSADKTKGVVILSNLGPNERIPTTVIGAKILTD